MNFKYITKGLKPFLAVGIPSLEFNFITNSRNFINLKSFDKYKDLRIVGNLSTMKESQLKMFVGCCECDFKNYLIQSQYVKTSKQSFITLLISEGMILKNWIYLYPECVDVKLDKYFNDILIAVENI